MKNHQNFGRMLSWLSWRLAKLRVTLLSCSSLSATHVQTCLKTRRYVCCMRYVYNTIRLKLEKTTCKICNTLKSILIDDDDNNVGNTVHTCAHLPVHETTQTIDRLKMSKKDLSL